MTQLQCVKCAAPLVPDDVFCGGCGTPVGAPARPLVQDGSRFPAGPVAEPVAAWPVAAQTAARPVAEQAQAWPHQWSPSGTADASQPRQTEPPQPDAFFTHATGQRRGPLSNATRYLCAAAYLDPTYPNTVIGELIASHRAVVPSIDIDLIPIIRHCLNARRAQILRDILLTIVLIGGLFLAPAQVAPFLIAALVLGVMLPGVDWERHSIVFKIFIGLLVFGLFGGFIVSLLLLPFLFLASRSPSNFGLTAGMGGGTGFVALVFLGLVGMTLFGYSYSMYKTFLDRLSPGADAGRFDRAAEQAETRIAQVEAAQWGNVAIYGGENPFIGSGSRDEAWSIAIELDRAPGPEKGRPWHEPRSRGHVSIDPVELHKVIRERLLKLGDRELPENERVLNLAVRDYVVGSGNCRWDSPVIDHERMMPYSQANSEAIDALIRHPQAGMRYYQRVCVNDEGQAVWSGRREVIGSADQEIAVSAFIYVAVEGRMFYLEFVPVIMPPILPYYHLIDRLPRAGSSSFRKKVFMTAARTACRDALRAPFGLAGTLYRMIAERRSFEAEADSARDYAYADIGARLSVREIRATLSPRTYIQQLDAAKYTKMIERLVNDTVLDFLEDKGVDTGAYRESAQAIINNSGIMMSGGSIGAVAQKGGKVGKVKMQNKGTSKA